MPATVGFTGHRPNRLHVSNETIERCIREVLRLLSAASTPPRIAISALAEGSDRLFASAAIAEAFELHAVFPFTVADYLTTFADASATSEFRALENRAARVEALPGRLDENGAAYERAGHVTVDRSDVLMTVWDGKPSAGRGGTTEIIAYARDISVPVIWISAVDNRPACLFARNRRRDAVAVILDKAGVDTIIEQCRK